MGYNTYYELSIDDTQFKIEIAKKKAAEVKEIQESNISNTLKEKLIKDVIGSYVRSAVTQNDVVNLLTYNPFGDKCKWYDHEDDMRNVSKNFKDVLFVLTGNGEEAKDMWVKYFLNGKMQVENAVITYGEFDKNKLK
jgi:hypothetical protein